MFAFPLQISCCRDTLKILFRMKRSFEITEIASLLCKTKENEVNVSVVCVMICPLHPNVWPESGVAGRVSNTEIDLCIAGVYLRELLEC